MSSSELITINALTRARLEAAWDHVRTRGGAPGIDGLTVERFGLEALRHLDALFEAIVTNAWRPKPARRVILPDDPDRPIAVATVADRIVHRAIADALTQRLDGTLSPAAWAYRPGRGVLGALREVEAHLSAGRKWIVRADIAHFFDEIDHARVLSELPLGAHLRRLIERILGAGVSLGAAIRVPGRGVPQGSPLSPILANLYLRPVDEALHGGRAGFLRYADDMIILCTDAEQAREGLAELAAQVEARGLTLKPRKTWRGHVAEGVDFLGARFDAAGRGPSTRALKRLAQRTDELLDSPDALARFVTAWQRWYGPVHRHADVSLGAIAGAALGARTTLPAVSALSKRRLNASAGGLPAPLHARLVSVWLGGGEEALPCAVIDARAAVRRGLTIVDHRRLMNALALPADAIGALREPLRRLPALFAAHGQIRLADAARSLVEEAASAPIREAPGDDRLLELLGLCLGRQDSHLQEKRDKRKHLCFQPVDGPIDSAALRAHLVGERRRAIYLCRSDGTVAMAILELRVRRQAALPPWADGGVGRDARAHWSGLRAQVHDFAVHTARIAEKRGWPCAIEAGGRDERRLWLFFEQPVPLHHAYRALLTLREAAGDPPESVVVRQVPRVDRIRKGPGPWIPLPLGRDPRTGRDARLLDGDGRLADDEIGALCAQPRIAVGRMRPAWNRGPVADEEAVVSPRLDGLPHARRVLDGCPMLRALSEKAQRIGLLDGEERSTLYESLAFLPAEERLPALTMLLGPTGDDRVRVARRLRRLPAWPIACASIRKRHPQLSCEVGCKCRFRSERPGYATPVLHALRPDEIAIFRQKKSTRSPVRPPKPAKKGKAVNRLPRAPESPVATAATDAPAPRLSEPAPTSSGADNPAPGLEERIAGALKKLANLRNQRESVTRGIERAEAALGGIFAEQETRRLRVAHGWLVYRPDGEPRFVIEL